MIRFSNNSQQTLSLAYSNKGYLVFLFRAGNSKYTSVCYYPQEICYNAKLLKIASDNIITSPDETKEWLKSVTLKFTTANNDFIYLLFTGDSFIVKCVNNQGQEIYSFIHPLDESATILLAEYIGAYATIQAITDMLASTNRTQNRNNQNYRGYPQQYPQTQVPNQTIPVNNPPVTQSVYQQQPIQPQIQQPQMPQSNLPQPGNNNGMLPPNGFPAPNEI